LNDASEGAAFQSLFVGATSRSRPETDSPRISSTKAAIGHTLGAAGAVEAVFAIQALLTGELPPQINLRTPEPAVAGNLVAPGETAKDLRATMSVNLGFGGSNAALIFQRYES
jgi:3-oxoacyl-[acyl-carrier-protein] synthase II